MLETLTLFLLVQSLLVDKVPSLTLKYDTFFSKANCLPIKMPQQLKGLSQEMPNWFTFHLNIFTGPFNVNGASKNG